MNENDRYITKKKKKKKKFSHCWILIQKNVEVFEIFIDDISWQG